MVNNSVIFDLDGDLNLVEALKNVPLRVQESLIKSAFRKPAKRIEEAEKRLAPASAEKASDDTPPGFLKQNLKARRFTDKRAGLIGQRIGATVRAYPKDKFYARFQEEGWLQGERQFSTRVKTANRQSTLDYNRMRIAELMDKRFTAKSNQENAKRINRIGQLRRQMGEIIKAEKHDKRRKIPGKFFVRRAFDANKAISITEMRAEIIASINKEMAKYRKGQEKKWSRVTEFRIPNVKTRGPSAEEQMLAEVLS